MVYGTPQKTLRQSEGENFLNTDFSRIHSAQKVLLGRTRKV